MFNYKRATITKFGCIYPFSTLYISSFANICCSNSLIITFTVTFISIITAITTEFGTVATFIDSDMVEEDLKKLSTHSAQVFALVLRLSEANCKPDFLKSRLRWMGEYYQSYRRDTAEIKK